MATVEEPLIAVVDDDESVARAIKRLLRSAGVAADTYRTGQDLLDAFESSPDYRPGCMVLDIHTPDAGGLDAIRRLMEKEIPVIFTTAYDELDIEREKLAQGASALLRKPFNDEVLIDAVRTVLKRDS
jgi:FixJ family two-component response regulator